MDWSGAQNWTQVRCMQGITLLGILSPISQQWQESVTTNKTLINIAWIGDSSSVLYYFSVLITDTLCCWMFRSGLIRQDLAQEGVMCPPCGWRRQNQSSVSFTLNRLSLRPCTHTISTIGVLLTSENHEAQSWLRSTSDFSIEGKVENWN